MRLYIFNTLGPRLRELARVRVVIALLRRRYKMHNDARAPSGRRADALFIVGPRRGRVGDTPLLTYYLDN